MTLFILITALMVSLLLAIRPEPASLRSPMPSFGEHLNSVKISLSLSLLILVIFLFTSDFGFLVINEDIRTLLSLNNVPEMKMYWPFEVITGLFIHLNLEHVLSNAAALMLLSVYERRVGSNRYLMVLIVGAVASVPSILFFREPVMVCGISGGASALAAAFFVDHENITVKEWFIAIFLFLFISLFVSFQGTQYGSSLPDFQVDHGGHILGAIGGILYCRFRRGRAVEKRQFWNSASVSSVAFIGTVSLVILLVGVVHFRSASGFTGEFYSGIRNNNELYYEGLSGHETSLYVDTLRAYGLFLENYELKMKLQRDSSGVALQFHTKKTMWDSPAVLGYYCALKRSLEKSFGSSLTLQICDGLGKRRKYYDVDYSDETVPLKWLDPTHMEIKKRTLLQLCYWRSFFQYAIDNGQENVNWVGIPIPFNIASNGIALLTYERLGEDWLNLYDSEEQAVESYRYLVSSFDSCRWVETGDIYKSLVAIFDQMISSLEEM